MSGVVRKSVLPTDNGEALKPEPRGYAATRLESLPGKGNGQLRGPKFYFGILAVFFTRCLGQQWGQDASRTGAPKTSWPHAATCIKYTAKLDYILKHYKYCKLICNQFNNEMDIESNDDGSSTWNVMSRSHIPIQSLLFIPVFIKLFMFILI